MITGILNSINTKDRLYKTLLKTDTNSDDYRVAKANFKCYREILRNSIEMAKMLYYKRTFNLYQNDIKKIGQSSKRLNYRRRSRSFLQSLSGMIRLSLILMRLLINLIHIL